MCVICVLCLIVVSLPPGKNPSAVELNYNNNNNNIFGAPLCAIKAAGA
jgi:hypothetical protein